MRPSPKTFPWSFLGLSLSVHLSIGAALYGANRRASEPVPVVPRPPEAVLSGDTFDVPAELVPEAPAWPEPFAASEPAAAPAPPSPPLRRAVARAAPTPGSAGGGDGTAGTVFGASSDRASVDLATAFTRGFPQAASADPAWATAPLGPAGEATVVLEIDETGALVSSRIEGTPTPALRAGILRTLALLRARAFTASRPLTRLRVAGSVSPDAIHDGLHGEVFAIGGSFDKQAGSAFFALAIGRRIDLRVRE